MSDLITAMDEGDVAAAPAPAPPPQHFIDTLRIDTGNSHVILDKWFIEYSANKILEPFVIGSTMYFQQSVRRRFPGEAQEDYDHGRKKICFGSHIPECPWTFRIKNVIVDSCWVCVRSTSIFASCDEEALFVRIFGYHARVIWRSASGGLIPKMRVEVHGLSQFEADKEFAPDVLQVDLYDEGTVRATYMPLPKNQFAGESSSERWNKPHQLQACQPKITGNVRADCRLFVDTPERKYCILSFMQDVCRYPGGGVAINGDLKSAKAYTFAADPIALD